MWCGDNTENLITSKNEEDNGISLKKQFEYEIADATLLWDFNDLKKRLQPIQKVMQMKTPVAAKVCFCDTIFQIWI